MGISSIKAIWLGLVLSVPSSVFAADDTTLFDDLGGQPVLEQMVSDMLGFALDDPQMAPIFADSDMERLENLLVLHFCELADGPCDYDGQDMRRTHDGLGIRTLHFNRLVEDLQAAMDVQDIPFRTQNRLLARLAPFHDDVTERSPVPPRGPKAASHSVAPLTASESAPAPALESTQSD